jgi:hypothetical protein
MSNAMLCARARAPNLLFYFKTTVTAAAGGGALRRKRSKQDEDEKSIIIPATGQEGQSIVAFAPECGTHAPRALCYVAPRAALAARLAAASADRFLSLL